MDNTLIKALQNPELYNHPITKFQLFETHISWVILTGTFAYKIKKPLDFGFLDFSSLERRKLFCEEEVRLNSRLSPQIYKKVVPIYGTPENPSFQASGTAMEYAVQMSEFKQSELLDNLLAEGLYTSDINHSLALTLANFHQKVEIASPQSPFGTPARVQKTIKDNFEIIRPLLNDKKDLIALSHIEDWAETQYTYLQPLLAERKTHGFIRECHGDIHLGNVAKAGSEICVFDCIEFNPDYRWVDVMSDIAFLYMDLKKRGQEHHAATLINTYVERTGDYQGLQLLCYYTSYRAMVRAKIAMLRRQQTTPNSPEWQQLYEQYQQYLKLAQSLTEPSKPALLLMNGVSGSGKSSIAQKLIELLPAIRLRSDVERKRLAGLKAEDSSATLGKDLYTPEMHQKTFDSLRQITTLLLQAGFIVIVDATFLRQRDRAPFLQIAQSKHISWLLVQCEAPLEVLERRIQMRTADPSEATVAVLHKQLQSQESLTPEEQQSVFVVSTKDESLPFENLAKELKTRLFMEKKH